MQKLALKDLIQVLDNKLLPTQSQQSLVGKTTEEYLISRSQKIQQFSLKEQLSLKRQSTYRTTQQQMDKWIGIVKLNRQRQTINFSKTEKDNASSVMFFSSTPLNQFQRKIEVQLKKMQIQSQQSVLNTQESILQKLSKEQIQERLKEARRQRSLVFNQEIKRRRIAKIKSKLYHKIKKRQKLREESKRIEGMDGEQKNQYLQKLSKQRIQQRITLRHKSKNKHIQNLLRFNKNNATAIQDSLNQVNLIRKQQLEKINQAFLEQMSEEYDDQKYRQQALQDLQQEIDQIEEENEKPQNGLEAMKFMRIGKQNQLNQEKKDAQQLIHLLQEQQRHQVHLDLDNQDDPPSQKQKEITRRKFGSTNPHNQSNLSTQNFTNSNIKKVLTLVKSSDQLTAGVDIAKLKQKYQPNRADLDLTDAIAKNASIFGVQNESILDNYRDFQATKNQNYQEALPTEQKALKGWGNWAGPGISQPKINHALEVKKKLAKIEQIKRKRKDGELSGVLIRETYNKSLKDYFVNKLPHNFKTAEQFDYLQDEKVGSEWNTLNQLKSNIKPKVITKVGQVIQAIRLPKKLEKNIAK